MAIDYTRYTHDPVAANKAQTAADAAAAEYNRLYKVMMDAQNAANGQRRNDPRLQDAFHRAVAAVNEASSARTKARNDAKAASLDTKKQGDTRVMDATYGLGNQISTDPRITAAMDAMDPTKTQNNLYSQLTDANAAQAGVQAEMLRNQTANLGPNDPAVAARLRQIDTSRMQGNNAALATSEQAGQSAASQLAQTRLNQLGLVSNLYAAGTNYDMRKDLGTGQNVPLGMRTSVPNPGSTAVSNAATSPWQAPQTTTQAAGANTNTTTPKPATQAPATPAPTNTAVGKWKGFPYAYPSQPNTGTISTTSTEAQKRLNDQKNKTGEYTPSWLPSWAPSGNLY